MTLEEDLKTSAEALKAAQKIAIFSHMSPDPDAYGSQCGLAAMLSGMGKEVQCYNESGINETLTFIPGVSQVRDMLPENPDWDLMVVCDCGDQGRIGDFFGPQLLKLSIPVLNIDHHVSNDRFGAFNIVSSTHSSTSELIYELALALEVSLEADTATALLSGIIADTGSFRYPSTSNRTFEVAAALLQSGASLDYIAQGLYGSQKIEAVRLQAEALLNLKLHGGGAIAGTVVSRELLKKHSAVVEDVENLAERARDIAGVSIAYAAREHEDLWKVSLRAKGDKLDVSGVAKSFGGGGHRAAAAFRSRKPFSEIEALLLKRLEEVLGEK